MKVKIDTVNESYTLPFSTKELFELFTEQVKVALLDETNTKGAKYESDKTSMYFPSLLLKNSVVEISKDSQVFFF